MAKRVLIEEYHVSVFVPAGLPAKEQEAIRRALDDTALAAGLRRAVRRAFRCEADLSKMKVRVSK